MEGGEIGGVGEEGVFMDGEGVAWSEIWPGERGVEDDVHGAERLKMGASPQESQFPSSCPYSFAKELWPTSSRKTAERVVTGLSISGMVV